MSGSIAPVNGWGWSGIEADANASRDDATDRCVVHWRGQEK